MEVSSSSSQMTVAVALIQALVHPTMSMVHVDSVIMTGLIPHQDH